MEENSEIYRGPKYTMRWLSSHSLYMLGVAFVLALIAGGFVSCTQKEEERHHIGEGSTEKNSVATGFFGDTILTIISANRPNGYLVKIFQTKDLTLFNFSRGDSINRYITLDEIPLSLSMGELSDLTYGDSPDSIGTYIREINIPVKRELGYGLFFMDVNFDGEEELIIEHLGYNRTYYACFDIVNGSANITPGILQPMNDAPFNNIVSGGDDTYTEFDYDKKTIHIFEQLGCCSHVETWCEMVRDYKSDVPKIKVVRREDVEYTTDGYVITTNYKRVEGELKNVSSTRKKCNS
ncbi:MAG: hypothetical protein K2M13_08480 [Muribaculaceae bacterium]|nr:hypothetical protein [Muribaculaceae bacterium]